MGKLFQNFTVSSNTLGYAHPSLNGIVSKALNTPVAPVDIAAVNATEGLRLNVKTNAELPTGSAQVTGFAKNNTDVISKG